jgi:hypothetical protein
MFNVYRNQLSRQTGSRNLMGPKTLPTIWGTHYWNVLPYIIEAIYMNCNYIPAPRRERGYTVFYTPAPRRGRGVMKLATKYQIHVINSCLEKCDEKCAYMYMFNVYRNQLSRQTGSSILWEAFLDPSDSYFLFADLVGFYTHWTYMHIFCHIFLSNYWWQKSDIWSQASYRYPISWNVCW